MDAAHRAEVEKQTQWSSEDDMGATTRNEFPPPLPASQEKMPASIRIETIPFPFAPCLVPLGFDQKCRRERPRMDV